MRMPATALVIGATGGLGRAVAEHLEGQGARVLRRSRSTHGVDLTQESSVAALAASLRQDGVTLDWIFVATGALTVSGAPPELALKHLDPSVMAESFAINTIGPALLLKHLVPLMPRDRPSVFAALSARLASIGDNRLGGWISYRASKAALNQVLRTASVEISRRRPQSLVVALHPGTVETALSQPYARGRYTATPEQAAAQLIGVLEGLEPTETGRAFDYKGEPIPW